MPFEGSFQKKEEGETARSPHNIITTTTGCVVVVVGVQTSLFFSCLPSFFLSSCF